MKIFFRAAFKILGATLLLCVALEAFFRAAGEPPGATRFSERIIIKEGLSPKKPAGEFRIFTYGESTMHGAHYAPVSSPARWLEKYLKDFLPDKKIRVVNFARMGRGTEFACQALEETLPYHPDLVLVYLGHNIFLNRNRKEDVEAQRKTFRHGVRSWQKQSRFFSAVYRRVIRLRIEWRADKPEDRMEFPVIETAPLAIGPESITPRNSEVYRENIEFFREYLVKMHALAQENGVPILFLGPVSNLKDFAPYFSMHLKKLSSSENTRWERSYRAGKASQARGNFDTAKRYYLEAYQIDSTYADLTFRLGQIEYRKGNFAQAKIYFETARDNDAIIFRATREALEALEDLKKTEGVELLDTGKFFAAQFPGGIFGEPLVEDNVHFSLKGHALMGRFMAEEIAKRNLIAPGKDWQFQRQRPYEEIAKELGIDQELLFSADLKMVHFFGSRFENRVRFAQKALRIHPDDPRALRHLAWTYWLMGEKTKALKVYLHLQRVHPEVFEEIFSNVKKFGESIDKVNHYQSSNLIEDLGRLDKNGLMGRPK